LIEFLIETEAGLSLKFQAFIHLQLIPEHLILLK